MAPHRRLEERLAAFKGYESALLFGSGYLANVGTISALAGRGTVVFSDELNHASIVDGCRLARAETFVYRHGDAEHLAWGLRQAGGRGSLIVSDGVFSMDGDIAPLEDLALARRHGCRLMVDEAHATGALGPGGRGSVAAAGLGEEVDVVVGTLGKALGSYGAYACASAELREYLLNTARSFIFSTALPPPVVAAALASLELLEAEPTRVRRLRANAAALREGLRAEGLERRRRREPDRAARGRRGRADDGALRAPARARRLRPGHPPPDRPPGLLAPALQRDGDAHEAELSEAARQAGEAAREVGLLARPPSHRRLRRLTRARATASSSPGPGPRSARRSSPPRSPASSPPKASA